MKEEGEGLGERNIKEALEALCTRHKRVKDIQDALSRSAITVGVYGVL